MSRRAKVVIVGGGFGGLAAAKALRGAAADVVLVDRTNHHLFQPLLYQVATAGLAPGDIAAPVRQILRAQKNATVLLAEATGVEAAARQLVVAIAERGEVRLDYDFLILATGVAHSYFGHEEFARFAPGLKTLEQATSVRGRILGAFERAEAQEDPATRRDLLTVVLVGAGPTGVEMAGAIAELARVTLIEDFRRVDPASARIVLVEAGPRILPTFHASLARRVHARLERMGVEVRLGQPVTAIDERGAVVGGERIEAGVVLWTAGVEPSPAAAWLGAATDRAGRVLVEGDLSVPGRPEVFVVGDVAAKLQDGAPLPGVAQVALQGGRYVGRLIARRLAGRPALPPFRYRDKGNLAVVGRNYAVLERGRLRLSGWLAWVLWATIHITYLAQFNNRLLVFTQWLWSYFTWQRGSRLILGRH
jgi:NADH dehydrogenase FAD-containing subunit